MELFFNSFDDSCRSPVGAATQNEPFSVTVRTDQAADALYLVLRDESGFRLEMPMERVEKLDTFDEKTAYTASVTLWRCGLYFYFFRAVCGGETSEFRRCRRGSTRDGGTEWEISVCPRCRFSWREWAGKPMYQIFPDRFYAVGQADLTGKLTPYHLHGDPAEPPDLGPDQSGVWNSDFYGGNLRGIAEKLPYLRELGMEVIYLNPIFMAQSNHRYDTADYLRIDPMLGTDDDFAALCAQAHALGMRVILDGVFSHTGSNSMYFDANHVFGNGVMSDRDSPYKTWYALRDDGTYDCWWGVKTLPCLRETEPSFLRFLLSGRESVVGKWLGLGADGFRLDVADELPDAFLTRFREAVSAQKPDAVVLGEVWEDASDKISYGVRRRYFTDYELDCVMNYPFRDAILNFIRETENAAAFCDRVMEIISHYPAAALHCSMVPLSTHDTPRVLTLMGPPCNGSKQEKAAWCLTGAEYMEAVQRVRTAMFLQFMLPGMPSVYYGDEIGMQGWEDPLNRGCFQWEHMDERLHGYVIALAAVRRNTPALMRGELRLVSDTDNCLVMERCDGSQNVRFCVNMSDSPVTLACRKILATENGVRGDGTVTVYKFGAVCYLPEEVRS